MAEEWIYIQWEKGSRYYEARLHPDLWGCWVLTRIWGGKETQLGRIENFPCASYQEGRKQLAIIQARRKRHGYKMVIAKN
ncbi:hypothetical protein Nhal_4006 (plasmid) [Nitrosococcus halophilus Nc 4]|uniref:WGR domain-containing protein n=1 Tax=Nitrosococcus halophilus (strain Nc4) TaxID=472759 RepID=D5C5G0_NITHN|nr:WGR domain-containing protein [Nitrosococcus halophilus]ADE17014.1 hypothetical protein Nhal_4006 [Nitrosococcus halophilus Nc 4]